MYCGRFLFQLGTLSCSSMFDVFFFLIRKLIRELIIGFVRSEIYSEVKIYFIEYFCESTLFSFLRSNLRLVIFNRSKLAVMFFFKERSIVLVSFRLFPG